MEYIYNFFRKLAEKLHLIQSGRRQRYSFVCVCNSVAQEKQVCIFIGAKVFFWQFSPKNGLCKFSLWSGTCNSLRNQFDVASVAQRKSHGKVYIVLSLKMATITKTYVVWPEKAIFFLAVSERKNMIFSSIWAVFVVVKNVHGRHMHRKSN